MIPDPDESTVALANALDSTLDAASAALASGDVDTAMNLVVAAETVSDQLLEVLGVPEVEPGEAD